MLAQIFFILYLSTSIPYSIYREHKTKREIREFTECALFEMIKSLALKCLKEMTYRNVGKLKSNMASRKQYGFQNGTTSSIVFKKTFRIRPCHFIFYSSFFCKKAIKTVSTEEVLSLKFPFPSHLILFLLRLRKSVP